MLKVIYGFNLIFKIANEDIKFHRSIGTKYTIKDIYKVFITAANLVSKVG